MTQPKDTTFTESKRNALNSQLQFAKDLSAKMIIDEMALYDKYFSQNEINDFIAFYKSPSGKKLINVTPDIQNDLMAIMMQKYMPEIQKSIKEKSQLIKSGAK